MTGTASENARCSISYRLGRRAWPANRGRPRRFQRAFSEMPIPIAAGSTVELDTQLQFPRMGGHYDSDATRIFGKAVTRIFGNGLTGRRASVSPVSAWRTIRAHPGSLKPQKPLKLFFDAGWLYARRQAPPLPYPGGRPARFACPLEHRRYLLGSTRPRRWRGAPGAKTPQKPSTPRNGADT